MADGALCTRRWQAGPAYVRDVRCTMYDVRFGEFPRLRASVAERMRGAELRGDGRTVAPSGAYVRGTMYDVRFGNSRACARVWRSGCGVNFCGVKGGAFVFWCVCGRMREYGYDD